MNSTASEMMKEEKRLKDGDYVGDFRVPQEIVLQSSAQLRACNPNGVIQVARGLAPSKK